MNAPTGTAIVAAPGAAGAEPSTAAQRPPGGATEFKRLDPDSLAGWLEDYSLSDLYDKNVLGGRP